MSTSEVSTAESCHGDAVTRAIEEMYAHFDEPLALRRLAEVARFSPYHFHRLFSATTGLSPARFLAAIRLEEAKRLLLTGPRSVTDICMSVGYSSLGTFSSRFRASVGVSPSDLRRFADDAAVVARVLAANEAVAGNGTGTAKGAATANGHDWRGWASIHGHIDACKHDRGPIFVGLFPTSSPERAPVACTVLSSPGRFSMNAPTGNYHILAMSFGPATDPLGVLLPDRASVLVGGHRAPLRLRHGAAFVRFRLRRPTILDPPVLVALPALLSPDASNPASTPMSTGRRPELESTAAPGDAAALAG